MVEKKRVEKTLVYPNGKNRLAHIGMIDSSGATCYMLDTGNTEYFAFADFNDLLDEMQSRVDKAEHEKTLAYIERDRVLAINSRQACLIDRLMDVSNEMYSICKFPHGSKLRICAVLGNARRDHREIKAQTRGAEDEQQ